MNPVQNIEILAFTSSKEWRQWLAKNHNRTEGIWLRFYKKASSVPSVTYDEALDEALCYGWIDGQLKPYDERSWLRKFTPRRAKSPWSRRNIEYVQRLIKAGRMKDVGLREAEAAKVDDRWMNAYDPGSTMTMPADFLKRLSRMKKAKAFFETLNKANTYAIAWRLQSAKKPETREKRMKAILAMLAKEEKFHD
ncbi:MAG: YdeI/OmpD-associated family protein [Ignavibacteriales bacterium]|nr:YdeI/OmpD-associated family protein [Ignavibacteriales bacterium]